MPFGAPTEASGGLASIPDLILSLAERCPAAAAITAPGRRPLAYGALARLVRRVTTRLSESGIGPGDCVAVVLPNGPEMASTFLSIASVATCAP